MPSRCLPLSIFAPSVFVWVLPPSPLSSALNPVGSCSARRSFPTPLSSKNLIHSFLYFFREESLFPPPPSTCPYDTVSFWEVPIRTLPTDDSFFHLYDVFSLQTPPFLSRVDYLCSQLSFPFSPPPPPPVIAISRLSFPFPHMLFLFFEHTSNNLPSSFSYLFFTQNGQSRSKPTSAPCICIVGCPSLSHIFPLFLLEVNFIVFPLLDLC